MQFNCRNSNFKHAEARNRAIELSMLDIISEARGNLAQLLKKIHEDHLVLESVVVDLIARTEGLLYGAYTLYDNINDAEENDDYDD